MDNLGWRVFSTLVSEFSDFPDVEEFTRMCVRITMAVILGGMLGYEREAHGKAAGLRTHMLVALGAAMFVLVPLQAGMEISDLSRVLQGVVAGIGFLGAGAILKLAEGAEIRGLTTAASIWMTAAVGVAAGMGREATAVITTLFALFILSALRHFSHEHRKNHDHDNTARHNDNADHTPRSDPQHPTD